jgi:hypothetical protein
MPVYYIRYTLWTLLFLVLYVGCLATGVLIFKAFLP